jgi:hypothetical protein
MNFRSIKLQTVRKLQEQNTGNMLKGWKNILTWREFWIMVHEEEELLKDR